MVPLIVQIITTLVARRRVSWRAAARFGMAAMLLFTATSHFLPMKSDLAAMIPPPFTGAMWIIYVTGVLEAAGAIGLLIPGLRRAAGLCLIILLLAMFPANVYAALEGLTIRGAAATPLWLRMPLQLFWMMVLWWSAVARPATATAGRTEAATA